MALLVAPAATASNPHPEPPGRLGAVGEPVTASPAVGIIATASGEVSPEVLAEIERIVGRGVVGQVGLGSSTVAVRFSKPRPAAAIAALSSRLSALPEISSVTPDLLVETDALPNDTYFSRQVNLYSPDVSSESSSKVYTIDAPTLWDATAGLKSVVVAVLDGGIVTHSDLTGQKIAGYDMISDKRYAGDGSGRDSNPADPGNYSTGTYCPVSKSTWHGTHVSGIVSALRNNAKGISGIAPGAALQPVRVVGRCVTSMSDVIAGIRWASGGHVSGISDSKTRAKVINLSLSSSVSDFSCPAAYREVIDEARSRGAMVVGSAGNQSASVLTRTPANCDGVVSVGAVAPDGSPTTYTNVGKTLDMVAPGGVDPKVQPGLGIWSTVDKGTKSPDGSTYKEMSGTSMAAPAVSAAAALVFSLGDFTADQVTQVLKAAAVRPPKIDGYYTCLSDDADGNERNVCGAGILNLARIPAPTSKPTIAGSPTPDSTLTLTPGTWNGSPTVAHQWLRDGQPIAGETGLTHVVTQDDVGHVLAVRSTASAAGYPDFTSLSANLPVPTDEPAAPSFLDFPDGGNLYEDPTTFSEGQLIKITANFPDGRFNVTLYKETAPGTWTAVGTDDSNSSGNAYFLNYQVNGTQKLVAVTSTGKRTEVDTLTPSAP
jgi:serine protease